MSNQNLSTVVSSVDTSAIDSKHVKERMTACALGALALVTKAHVSAAIKCAAAHVDKMVNDHPTPTGTDVKRTRAIWGSRQAVAMLLAVFQSFVFAKPTEMVNQVWNTRLSLARNVVVTTILR